MINVRKWIPMASGTYEPEIFYPADQTHAAVALIGSRWTIIYLRTSHSSTQDSFRE